MKELENPTPPDQPEFDLIKTALLWGVTPGGLESLSKQSGIAITPEQRAAAEENIKVEPEARKYKRGSDGFTVGAKPQTPGPRQHGK